MLFFLACRRYRWTGNPKSPRVSYFSPLKQQKRKFGMWYANGLLHMRTEPPNIFQGRKRLPSFRSSISFSYFIGRKKCLSSCWQQLLYQKCILSEQRGVLNGPQKYITYNRRKNMCNILQWYFWSHCYYEWYMYHTVRYLHFLSKNWILISRENCRFFWVEKLVKLLWFWTS